MADITSLLPSSGALLTDVSFDEAPSLTYAMHIEDQSIHDTTDGLECMRQAIYKILRTERYTYPVYSWDYGIELIDLFGKPTPYVEVELRRRIKEALEWDDRIERVDGFKFTYPKDKNTIYVQFDAHTTLGTVASDFVFSKIEADTSWTDPLFYVTGTTGVFTWRANVGVVGTYLVLHDPSQYTIDGNTLIIGD